MKGKATMLSLVEDYLAFRHQLGFTLRTSGEELRGRQRAVGAAPALKQLAGGRRAAICRGVQSSVVGCEREGEFHR